MSKMIRDKQSGALIFQLTSEELEMQKMKEQIEDLTTKVESLMKVNPPEELVVNDTEITEPSTKKTSKK